MSRQRKTKPPAPHSDYPSNTGRDFVPPIENLQKKQLDHHPTQNQLSSPVAANTTDLKYFQTTSNQSRIGLPGKDGIIEYFELSKIIRIESDNVYVTFHLIIDSKVEERIKKESIGKLEEILPADQFFRVHNRHIVNLMHVKKYNKREEYVVMCDDETVTVSRYYKHSLLSALSFYQ